MGVLLKEMGAPAEAVAQAYIRGEPPNGEEDMEPGVRTQRKQALRALSPDPALARAVCIGCGAL
eukprot:CAMPEP_0206021466 /NCGR_PEP_ID=MMETSP1464-20131121/32921_1 /ASSEMBLY_ACC=CAM_ASM_001124 /TAXON_ID=119497 /ORGANISM="Exanthemachrysis gayraliae, Strain RCC1523" /LENGTH=63 /DNA_ID=CAMNT_0053395411 /DNA_START=27 /DNA_END=214 /DNA_ORIENTATION=-